MNRIKSLISVIVPVYNVEQILPKCIESIIGQTYHNLQIILVDDGSTDNSGAICNYYATIDSRICVIHKEECRGGYSSARDAGLSIMTGDYLAFVNGGDSIEYKMYESMLYVAEEKKTDVVYCNINIRSEQEASGKYPFFDNASSILHSVLCGEYRTCLYNSLFRTEVWKRSNVIEIDGVDDVLEMFYQQVQFLSSNPRMAYVDYPYYNCHLNISETLFCKNSLPCINAIIIFLKNKKLYDIYKRDLFKFLVRLKLTFLSQAEYENLYLWTDATKHLPSYPFSLYLNLLYWIFLNTGLLGLKLYKIWNKLRYPTIKELDIRNTKETIAYILNNRVSVARFGDGEYGLMFNQMLNSTYQQQNDKLSMRLKEVLHSHEADLIVCLPYLYKNYRNLNQSAFNFYKGYIKNNKSRIISITPKTKTYYNSCFTRFYIDYEDKSFCEEIIELIKRIWGKRDVFIIEGEYSRLGMNNDLLDGCRSVHRILCPATNSWDKYDEILFTAKQLIPNDKDILVLISLGPTATVLAYDLSLSGYQAIDIGHINVEYIWYKMKAQKKTPLSQLYVNEVPQHNVPDSCSDPRYQSSIMATIK